MFKLAEAAVLRDQHQHRQHEQPVERDEAKERPVENLESVPGGLFAVIPQDMAFLDILSLVAITCTLGMFLTGITICRNIRQRGSSEGISAVPFALCSVSCFFWLRYGFLKNDRTVIFVNVVGLCLELVYLLYYYLYTPRKGPVHRLIALSLAVCAAMLFYIDVLSPTHSQAISHLGLMCLTLNILNFGAPLASVQEVFRKKDSESLPLPLIAANLVVALEWFLYGYLINDIYMKVPNLLGIVLSIIQLSLFVVFPARGQKRIIQ